MEVQVTNSELERRLHDLTWRTGLGADDVVGGGLAGLLEKFATPRHTLDSRYDGLRRGGAQPTDADEAIENLKAKSNSVATVPRKRSRAE
jgi:hypothetical protein